MTPTRVSQTSADRSAPPVGQAVHEPRVRPLPSTEPGPGARPREAVHIRSQAPPAAPVREDEVPVQARRAAHALVIMALEVVDRKRAPQHTRGAFPPHLIEMLRTLARVGVPGQHLGPARIHRLHIHAAGPAPEASGPVGSGGSATSGGSAEYEVCATYARGPRLFAVAARIRVTHTGATCMALRLA